MQKWETSLLMDNLKPYFAVLEVCRRVCFLILWAVLASPPKTAHTRPRFAGARASVQGTNDNLLSASLSGCQHGGLCVTFGTRKAK